MSCPTACTVTFDLDRVISKLQLIKGLGNYIWGVQLPAPSHLTLSYLEFAIKGHSDFEEVLSPKGAELAQACILLLNTNRKLYMGSQTEPPDFTLNDRERYVKVKIT